MQHFNHRVVTFTCTGCRDKDRMYNGYSYVQGYRDSYIDIQCCEEMFLLGIARPKGKSRIVCLIVSLWSIKVLSKWNWSALSIDLLQGARNITKDKMNQSGLSDPQCWRGEKKEAKGKEDFPGTSGNVCGPWTFSVKMVLNRAEWIKPQRNTAKVASSERDFAFPM